MALKHFLRVGRSVKLGGLHIGPLTLGGRWYEVAPLSVLQVHYLTRALAQFGEALGGGADVAMNMTRLMAMPPRAMAPLAAMVVKPAMRAVDKRRVSAKQLSTLLDALGECNDVAFIMDAMLPGEGGSASSGAEAGGVEDWVDMIVQLRPVYTHRQLLDMPFQELLEISKCIERNGRASRGDDYDEDDLPEGARLPSRKDLKKARKALSEMGWRLED